MNSGILFRKILGLTAPSGTGKTTLLVELIPLLRERGFRVALIKHTHHDFDIDTPGKDSFRLRLAGANPVLVGSRHRWALMKETPGQDEPVLADLIARLPQEELDLILVEGFGHERFPKIEIHRPSLGKALLYPEDPSIIAIAIDGKEQGTHPIPVLDLNRPSMIADFIGNLFISRSAL
uniref:Molybdopterin-guanine dinucleotide biosynthesis protein B n=1 Tax=Candidatus Kentrum sp. FM TaxID=2126340 RepID=A0A450TYY2_9GAMM|nr:MAG: molybdopterin-guanine dinucleotide biosynthesis protein B [Candidatus Kentron sp. FM]VFJ75170.1 MAG: molybdopterin-guanine dinucleotide biosynthesis protein B [Candidatus Kentron sp. FM]VFK12321.1 MAG: molybdopterin-guanine dinucleotide biosynthesis protein B [Candidatus Kentron sp. FM]